MIKIKEPQNWQSWQPVLEEGTYGSLQFELAAGKSVLRGMTRESGIRTEIIIL